MSSLRGRDADAVVSPNVGIAELGEDNLFHIGEDGLESITMVLVEIRRGRSLDQRLELGRRIVDICSEVLGVAKRTVLVDFTVHSGEERRMDWRLDRCRSLGGTAGYGSVDGSTHLIRTACRRVGHPPWAAPTGPIASDRPRITGRGAIDPLAMSKPLEAQGRPCNFRRPEHRS
jgi:hypothetical protein